MKFELFRKTIISTNDYNQIMSDRAFYLKKWGECQDKINKQEFIERLDVKQECLNCSTATYLVGVIGGCQQVKEQIAKDYAEYLTKTGKYMLCSDGLTRIPIMPEQLISDAMDRVKEQK